MCGIELFVVPLTVANDDKQMKSDKVSQWLSNRGPDYVGTIETSRLRLRASVLQMRRDLCQQPIRCGEGSYLAYNGEIYRLNDRETSSLEISDTEMVASWMSEILSSHTETSEILSCLTDVMSSIVDGEFAFCLVTPNAVFYGRDRWGRRSLLEKRETSTNNNNYSWSLASVSEDGIGWSEILPGIIYSRSLETGEIISLPLKISNPNWKQETRESTVEVCLENVSQAQIEAVEQLHYLLFEAVKRRIIPGQPVTILFSGGLDSVILAGLAAQQVDHILLVNVDFVESSSGNNVIAADTKAALDSYEELMERFPSTNFHLCRRTADWGEISKIESRIRHLIHPKDTTMDLNIATALWFAADAARSIEDKAYSNRVLLTGLGADEWFGGYTRHWTAYQTKGARGLQEELQLDRSRIWERNLGRDDRVYSDTAQEARFPYLDSSVTAFASDLPPEWCCQPELEQGLGTKWILRRVAENMGLLAASRATKRAIQFGSRMAQVSDRQRFGSRRKSRGTARS